MDASSFFDFQKYCSDLCRANRLAAENRFKFCTCSGIENLQGPLDRFRKDKAFFCVDDVNDGSLFAGKNGGWFKQRTLTVFIMHRHEFGNEDERLEKLRLCRELFSQVVSRMIVDADHLENELVYLKVDSILSREFGEYFLNGCTGLYFMIDVFEPVDLRYNNSQWLEI